MYVSNCLCLSGNDHSEHLHDQECNVNEESDDSDDDYSSIQRPAFIVTGEPDFDSGPPEDGLEYLRRVRYHLLSVFNRVALSLWLVNVMVVAEIKKNKA